MWVFTAPAGAQGFIAGVVTDSATGALLGDAYVEVLAADRRVAMAATADGRGLFRLGPLPEGAWVVKLARVGYSGARLDGVIVRNGQTTEVRVVLRTYSPLLETIDVVSRGPEVALTTPASTSVITREKLDERMAPTTFDYLIGQSGMDCASKGVMQRTCAARGSRSSSSGSLLMLTDGRYVALPAIGFNIPYLMPSAAEDIERIEVVRGPAGAMYGPNTERGVVQMITRSAFDAPGTTVSIAGGERELVQATLRHAGVAAGRVGYKISGDFLDGRDWVYVDSNDVASRDEQIQRMAGTGEIEWRASGKTTIKTGAGFAQAGRAVDLEPTIGAVQLKDWSFGNAFAELEHGTLLGRLFFNWNDSGESFSLWTGMPLEDQSNVLAGQIQHGLAVGTSSMIQYGVDFRRTNPRTNGTIHGRNENNDIVSETGAYVHGKFPLGHRFTLSAALRGDYHDRIDGVGLSPRVGLVFQPSEAQALRLTYGRGFATPDPNDLFADLFVQTLDPLPYDLRVSGMPADGYQFGRDCGGLCMRSPLTSNPDALRPSDATGLWPVAVEFIQSQGGPDLSGIPAPSAAAVGSYLAALNLRTEEFDIRVDAADVEDYHPEGRSTTDALELGYKALLGGRLRVGVDFAVAFVHDFFGSGVVGTPNAFLESTSLEVYLTQFMSPAEAASIAGTLDGVPLGVVNPVNSPDPNDILILRHQGGEFTRLGLDIDLEYALSNRLTIGGTYSWVNRDSIGSAGGSDESVLSAPSNKGALSASYRDRAAGWSVWGQGVAVESYPVQSGRFIGRIPSYIVLDLGGDVRLARQPEVGLAVTVTNVFDYRHQEYIGAPEIGRLLVVRLRTRF